MLNFVDIQADLRFRDRTGAPAITFALQGSKSTAPLDFQIETNEAASAFVAIRIDSLGNQISSTDIELSLLTYDSPYLLSDGQTDFITDLDCGLYYYLINGRWESEIFAVVETLTDGTDTTSDIQVDGLTFYDTEKDIDYQQRQGAPDILFAKEHGTNTKPLKFRYKATDSVTSFIVYQIDLLENVLNEIILDTSLITSDSSYHDCSGLEKYSTYLNLGLFYFVVNDRYKSKKFEVAELTCYKVENISIVNTTEGKPLTLSFDAKITGIEPSLDVGIDIVFSCGIPTVSDTINLTDDYQHFVYNILIPSGVSGNCTMTISTDLCVKTYSQDFTIAPADVCYLDLEDSGVLELEDDSGGLELEYCQSNILELIGGGNLELIGGGDLNLIN